jgi:glycosyltransferase involved in cell wall biosynthesis
MLSICITCKNRSKINYNNITLTPFPNLIKSLISFSNKLDDEIEFVVSDWNSTDWPLKEWLPDLVSNKFDFQIINAVGTFSRGEGRNIAFKYARGEKIFFVDADMEFKEKIVLDDAIKEINNDKVFFPICWSLFKESGGWWRDTGFGNFAATKEKLKIIGDWQVRYVWGKEDTDIFRRADKLFTVVREKYIGFVHQWHPEEKNLKR